MARRERVEWRLTSLAVVASVALGCSSDTTTGIVVSGSLLSCVAPACCLPVTIEADRVFLYQNYDTLRIEAVLGLPDAIPSPWSGEVEVSLPWGPSVTCASSVVDHPQRFIALDCPSVPFAGAPPCDSSVTVGLRPTTSTYAEADGTPPLCVGKPDGRVEFTVPIRCGTCPGITGWGYEPCYLPDEVCSYSAYTGTGSAMLPCSCVLSHDDGSYRWRCAIP